MSDTPKPWYDDPDGVNDRLAPGDYERWAAVNIYPPPHWNPPPMFGLRVKPLTWFSGPKDRAWIVSDATVSNARMMWPRKGDIIIHANEFPPSGDAAKETNDP
jgi:hypothetical protein